MGELEDGVAADYHVGDDQVSLLCFFPFGVGFE